MSGTAKFDGTVRSPLDNFIATDIATVGDYQYILKVAFGRPRQVIIQRVKTDTSEIRFVMMPHDVDIDTYWAGKTGYSYVRPDGI